VEEQKPIEFCNGALEALREFPETARREMGFQLDRVQRGLDPADWKPMQTIGAGVREIRVRDSAGAFRTLYIASFKDAIYVLHCFQKKVPKTSQRDIEIAQSRLKELIRSMK
jgi:phage-related protein